MSDLLFGLAPLLGVVLFWLFIFPKFNNRPGRPGPDGMVTIEPGLFSRLGLLACAGLSAGFLALTVYSVLTPGNGAAFWLLVGLPLSVLMAFGVYVIAVTRLRANQAHVEVKTWRGWETIPWDRIAAVEYHNTLGTRIRFDETEKRYVWVYGRGVPDVANMFAARGIPFDNAP